MRYAILVLLVLAGAASGQDLIDRMVAVVDEEPIFLSDVDAAFAEDLYLMRVRGEVPPTDSARIHELKRDLLEGIIQRRIVIVKAREIGIEVTRTEIEDALDQWLQEMIEAAGSEAAFLSELEKQGMTLKDFKARYRKDIEEQLLVSRFMRSRFATVEVSEDDVVRFYENKYDSIPELPEVVGISHIIIIPRTAADREAEILARVDEAMERLRGGESFAEVAAQVSDDISTRGRGGEIGLVSPDDLQPEIAEIALTLAPGGVSEPIRTRYGFEIVKLDAKEVDRYRLRHIFLRLYPDREDSLRAFQLATEVRSRLTEGESFELLARQFSDDEETREDGGFVGEVEMSALEDAYRLGLEGLNPGDISDVVRTRHGFQILKMISRMASRKPGFEEARDWVRGLIEARRREDLFGEWLDGVRDDVYVKRYDF
jgi:peptidyl-prolyl cis-trans isomerase SurA